MKKRKNPNKIDGVSIQNPVAKFAHQYNKAHVFDDKNKYRRNNKHKRQEDSPIVLVRVSALDNLPFLTKTAWSPRNT